MAAIESAGKMGLLLRVLQILQLILGAPFLKRPQTILYIYL